MVIKDKTTDHSSRLEATVIKHIETLARLTDQARFGEEMVAYLDTCAKFYRYSPFNQWLIRMAKPDATQVAGYHCWRRLGRHVKKGERGIQILAPCLYRRNPEDKDSPKEIRGFRTVFVWDLAQTAGSPLPPMPNWKSPEKNLELQDKLIAFAKMRNIEVHFKLLPAGIQGVSKGELIEISPSAGVKTIAHEICHSILHFSGFYRVENRAILELEAESTAWIVATHFGIGNLQSPNYLALWGADSEMILSHMDRVAKTAREIIEGVENIE